MKTVTIQITQRGADERDMWQSEKKDVPTENIITSLLEEYMNDDPFNGRGVASVDISINFPLKEWTKEEVEYTFSGDNEGYIQDVDDEFIYTTYTKC